MNDKESSGSISLEEALQVRQRLGDVLNGVLPQQQCVNQGRCAIDSCQDGIVLRGVCAGDND